MVPQKLSFLFLGLLMTTIITQAQPSESRKEKSNEPLPKNWHHLDPAGTGVQGISLENAYQFLKEKKRTGKKVIVAVIDSGIDTVHEDLKPVMWVNKKEIPGNGKDDDKNGYVDDVHGWNFLGGKDGRNVKEDSYEKARVFHKLKGRWADFKGEVATLSPRESAEYTMFLKAQAAVDEDGSSEEGAYMKSLLVRLAKGDSVIRKELGKEKYSAEDLKEYTTDNADAKSAKMMITSIAKGNNSMDMTNEDLLEQLNAEIKKTESAGSAPEEFRKNIVGDNEADFNDKSYGNNDIMAETPFHGTHCSGIIGAARNNGLGVDGIADNVEIMTLRAVPDGDEHDKDIAHAIRYAVDNGARVISMSFGKDFSPEKQWVDDAFKYAEKKGVLLVHAAGNDSKNIDTADNFPNPIYIDGKGRATNVITVGASGDFKNGGLTASFSNFGKKEVDVFAPGVAIYSTIPGGNKYGNASGTSMACPVVSGIAALIMEYYPTLSALQVKQAIESSVQAPQEVVKIPGSKNKVMLSEICKTGGIVNAYYAVQQAEVMSQSAPPIKPNKKGSK